MNNIYLHIGLPKTGTTFLQGKVFPLMKKVKVVHEMDMYHLLCTGVHGDGIDNGKVLVTNERLSGNLTDPFFRQKDRIYLIENLKRLFNNAKVLFCIRNSDSFLYSCYKQYCLSNWAYSFDTYRNLYDKECLNHMVFIYYLYELFGKDNVLVWSFEEFKRNPKGVVSKICGFVGVDDVSEDVVYSFVNVVKPSVIPFFRLVDGVTRSRVLHSWLSKVIKRVMVGW